MFRIHLNMGVMKLDLRFVFKKKFENPMQQLVYGLLSHFVSSICECMYLIAKSIDID